MGNYLIQITKNNVRISRSGTIEICNKGDWIEVSRMTAVSLVAENKASMADVSGLLGNRDQITIFVPEGESANLELFFKQVTIQEGYPEQLTPAKSKKKALENYLFLDAGYSFKDRKAPGVIGNPSQFSQVFEILQSFDVVLILSDYVKTVADMSRELETTEQITQDNRVLSYQTCAVGIANSKGGAAFYAAWQAEKEKGNVQALVRALFIAKPTVYYLPPNWGIYG